MDPVKIILTTGISGLVGILIWFRIVKNNFSLKKLLILTILTGIIIRVIFALFTPVFYAPDEESHFNYIKYIESENSLPIQTSMVGDNSNDWEYHQPPLYYYLLSPILKINTSTTTTVILVRLSSIIFWLINLFFAIKIIKALEVKNKVIKSFSISLICLLPTYTFLSSTINNDNFLITLGGPIIYLSILNHKKQTLKNTVLIALLLTIAFWIKFSAIIYAIIITILFLTQIKEKYLFKRTLHFLLIALTTLAMWLPLALRNLKLYGDFHGIASPSMQTQWPNMLVALRTSTTNILETFWSVSGIYNNIKFLPTIGILLTLFALVGLIHGLLSKKPIPEKKLIITLLLSIALNFFIVLRFGVLYSQGQGRHIYPLLIPIAVLLALGIQQLPITKFWKKAHIHLSGFLICYLLAYTGFSLSIMLQL